MQMIPDPDVVRIRKSYQIKGECLRIRILESGFGTFLYFSKVRTGTGTYLPFILFLVVWTSKLSGKEK